MRKRRLVKTKTNKSVIGSSCSASDEYEQSVPLSADHDEAFRAPFLNIDSLSASATYRAGVPSEWDVYTRKYIAYWKPEHDM